MSWIYKNIHIVLIIYEVLISANYIFIKIHSRSALAFTLFLSLAPVRVHLLFLLKRNSGAGESWTGFFYHALYGQTAYPAEWAAPNHPVLFSYFSNEVRLNQLNVNLGFILSPVTTPIRCPSSKTFWPLRRKLTWESWLFILLVGSEKRHLSFPSLPLFLPLPFLFSDTAACLFKMRSCVVNIQYTIYETWE